MIDIKGVEFNNDKNTIDIVLENNLRYDVRQIGILITIFSEYGIDFSNLEHIVLEGNESEEETVFNLLRGEVKTTINGSITGYYNKDTCDDILKIVFDIFNGNYIDG